jgi:hypothetical protein
VASPLPCDSLVHIALRYFVMYGFECSTKSSKWAIDRTHLSRGYRGRRARDTGGISTFRQVCGFCMQHQATGPSRLCMQHQVTNCASTTHRSRGCRGRRARDTGGPSRSTRPHPSRLLYAAPSHFFGLTQPRSTRINRELRTVVVVAEDDEPGTLEGLRGVHVLEPIPPLLVTGALSDQAAPESGNSFAPHVGLELNVGMVSDHKAKAVRGLFLPFEPVISQATRAEAAKVLS